MRFLILLLAISFSFALDPVYKYAIFDNELKKPALTTQKLLKTKNIHLGVIENSSIFADDAGIVALKTAQIDLLATNAITFQYVIPSLWVKLENAKKGSDQAIRDELDGFGFELVSIKFLHKKTLLIIANKRSFATMANETKMILKNNL